MPGLIKKSTSDVTVGTVAPSSPSNGDLWFNTNTGWNILMFYDSVRAKWLSVEIDAVVWSHDTADGNALRAYGIQQPQAGTGFLVSSDITLVAVSSRARGGNLTKAFRLDEDNAGTPVTKNSFSLVAGIYKDGTLNVDLSDGDDIWAYASAVDAAALDVTVAYSYRRRVTP